MPIPECGGRYTTFLERYSRPLFRQFRMMKMRVFHTKYFLWISLLLTIYSQVPNKRSSPRLLESRQKIAPPPPHFIKIPPFNIFSDFCDRPHWNLPKNRPTPALYLDPLPQLLKFWNSCDLPRLFGTWEDFFIVCIIRLQLYNTFFLFLCYNYCWHLWSD